MKSVFSISSLLSLLAAMSVASPGLAQQLEQRAGGRDQREHGDGARALLPARHAERAPEMQPEPGGYAMSVPPQRRERMTLEERRQLRRDINDAGRDIYRPAHGGHR